MTDNKPIRLTQTVKKGGCASKLPAQELKGILEQLSFNTASQLLVDSRSWDDSALWNLSAHSLQSDNVLVQTLDFFTPIVDDPYDFGRITAVNAMSDVYAMGGTPKLALCILAFPTKTLDTGILKPLMEGALERIHKAGAVLAGGHTIDDDTLKLGFAVTGFVGRDFWSNAKAQVGDALLLTKPLGVGTLVAYGKQQDIKDTKGWLREAIESMVQLNNVRDLISLQEVHAATDITGFGLLGHASHIAKASGVCLQINASCLPSFSGSLQTLKQGYLVRAHHSNAEYVQDVVDYGPSLSEEIKHLLNDPQTSGGLLLSVPANQADHIKSQLLLKFPHTQIIGKVLSPQSQIRLIIRD